jgi:hypothetical protein
MGGMKYRYLRIAFSATCGIVCLLLIALWVRSYWVVGFFDQFGTSTSVAFQHGKLVIQPRIRYYPDGLPISGKWIQGIVVGSVAMPVWVSILMVFMLGVVPWAPWLRWRFSLRTLLIAMTLVAAGLGLIVALSR